MPGAANSHPGVQEGRKSLDYVCLEKVEWPQINRSRGTNATPTPAGVDKQQFLYLNVWAFFFFFFLFGKSVICLLPEITELINKASS